MITQTRIVSPFPEPDDQLHQVLIRGNAVYLYWSEMTHAQRKSQRARKRDLERLRAEYVEEFGIYR